MEVTHHKRRNVAMISREHYQTKTTEAFWKAQCRLKIIVIKKTQLSNGERLTDGVLREGSGCAMTIPLDGTMGDPEIRLKFFKVEGKHSHSF